MLKFRCRAQLLMLIALPAISTGEINGQTDMPGRQLTDSDIEEHAKSGIRHGTPGIRDQERAAFAKFQRHALQVSIGQQRESGYRFLQIRRRLAEQQASSARFHFDLIRDLITQPEAYCGHPVILVGVVEDIRTDRVGPGLGTVDQSDSVLVTVILDHPPGTRVIVSVPVQTNSVWTELHAQPVMFVGYLFKLSDQLQAGVVRQTPIFVTGRLECLTSDIDPARFTVVSHRTEGVLAKEANAYYEVLKQVQLIDYASQQAAAREFRKQRISAWFEEARQQTRSLLKDAEAHRAAHPDDKAGYEVRRATADAMLTQRERQHQQYRQTPSEFPTFVDVFTHPDECLGMPITVTGHVRRCVSYRPQEDPLGLDELHELWLFTEHSQRNPLVIVCTALPADFPTTARTVDNVTVTGYFFKLYRYTADDSDRLAPMLLARQVDWTPRDSTAMQAPRWLTTFGTLGFFAAFAMLVFYLWHGTRRDQGFIQTTRAGGIESISVDLDTIEPNPIAVALDADSESSVLPFESDSGLHRGLDTDEGPPQ